VPNDDDLARWRENRQEEVDTASLYREIADLESRPELAQVYRRLADNEDSHADFWEEKLSEAKAPVPTRRPGWRPRVLGWLARRFGPGFVLPTLVGKEQAGSSSYSAQPDASTTGMPAEERSHARVLGAIAGQASQGVEGATIAKFEGRHRATSGNALRAAVLGANDGLLSNFSLVMGVAGAELSEHSILITGLAGLLAGAGSMALGEWISVQSSRELYQRQISIESEELRAHPAEEAEELKLIYQAKGLPEDQARALADRLVSDEATALDTLAREELGIDPEELGGSAFEAAATSFVLFALGAIIPVLPFLLLTGTTAVVVSVGLSMLGLFGIGAAITLMTGRSVLYSGARQMLFGLLAAAITFGIGKLIGANIGG
jgi:vacuolar iron transporter family protein